MRLSVLSFLATLHFFAVKACPINTVLSEMDESLEGNAQHDTMESDLNDEYIELNDDMMDEPEITRAEENLGMHYFQGDVLTTNDQMAKLNHMLDMGPQEESELQSRALVKDVRRTWEKGLVHYVINKNVDKKRNRIVKAAIKHWRKKTCLKFKPRKNEKDYVEFRQGNGCSSFVGRIGGKQHLVVGNKRHGCRVGNIIHEIGHAIGFFHEQSRPDRDTFVKINWQNVLKGYKLNFKKFSTRVIDSKDVGYDYGSIMHYPRKIFGKERFKPTIIPKKKPDAAIGQRISLSKPDILQVSKLYGCPKSTGDTDMDTDVDNNSDEIDENEMNTMPSNR